VELLEVSRREVELLGFQSSSGAHHTLEEVQIQRGLRGILEIRAPGLFLPSPDLLFGIFLEVIGHLWQQGRIVEELQHSSRMWHLPVGVWHFIRPRSTWHWSSSVIQPLEAYFVLLELFVATSIVYLLSHLLSIPDRHLHCSRFFYFMNKIIFEMFWLVYHIAYG
jgi:hypothetical protein